MIECKWSTFPKKKVGKETTQKTIEESLDKARRGKAPGPKEISAEAPRDI